MRFALWLHSFHLFHLIFGIESLLKYAIFLLQCRPTQSRFLQSRNLNCVALCEGRVIIILVNTNNVIQTISFLLVWPIKETVHQKWMYSLCVYVCVCTIPLKWTNFVFLSTVITSKDLQKHGNIWVCPISDHVCTRFFFVWVFLCVIIFLLQILHLLAHNIPRNLGTRTAR